jgi:hypothetical protein
MNPVRTPSRGPNKPDVRTPFIKALEAHVVTLKEQLAAVEARLAAADASLVAERETTEKAITAFAALAERLDALAAERTKPWWRRLVS